MNLCSIDGCEKKHKARGWCNAHYRRWLKHGDPLKTAFERASTTREAFDLRTQWDENGCLVWTGALSSSGYGNVYFRGSNWNAHRLAWTLVNGEVPGDLDVNHKCWNKACVNVEHLNLATRSQNVFYREGPNPNNTSGFRNVIWSERDDCWIVKIKKDRKVYQKYGFKTPEEASLYAEQLRKDLNGKFAGEG